MADEDVILVNAPPAGTKDRFSNLKIELPDDDPVVKALNLSKGQPEGTEQKTTETKTETAPTEQKAEPQPPTPAPEEGTAKPEVKAEKVPYTEDELRAFFKDPRFEKGEVHLDTSRIPDAYRAIYAEMQGGFTRKRQKELEDVKRERDEIERRRQEIAAFEERQRQLAEEQRFHKEAEELGQEEALRLKKEREMEARINRLEAERQASLQREAASMLRREYTEKATNYRLPTDQAWEDLAMSAVWAKNLLNTQNGLPLISLEDGMREISEQVGISNLDNLKKIIAANPQNEEALRNYYVSDYLKKKSAGATVPASTTAPVAEKPSDKQIEMDVEKFSKDPSAALFERVMKRLENENLIVK